MIYPVPLFSFREWGTHVAAGQTCPECLDGHLVEYLVCPKCLSQVFMSYAAEFSACTCGTSLSRPKKTPASLQCDYAGCRAFFIAAFHRNAYSITPPARIGSLETENMPLYASVQHYLEARPNDDALHAADFVMDIDRATFESALADLLTLIAPLEQHGIAHQVYYSGSKGFHVVIPMQVVGAKPASDLNTVQYRKLAHFMTELTGIEVDHAIYSRARLFREPLTIHGKTGLYKVPLRAGQYEWAREIAANPMNAPTHFLSDNPVTNAQLNSWLEAAQQRAIPNISSGNYLHNYNARPGPAVGSPLASSGSTVPCVRSALDNGPPLPGTRNKLNKVMASFFLSQGDDETAMLDWARHTPGASDMPTYDRVREARATYHWAKRTKYDFDCRDMKALGLCDPKCHLLSLAQGQNDLFGQLPTKSSL